MGELVARGQITIVSVGRDYTYLRYSDDGGQTFTAASQAAIDDARGSLPLDGRNLIDMSTLSQDEGVGPFTSVNAATNTFTTTVSPVVYGHFGLTLQPLSVFASHSSYTLSGYIKSSIAVQLVVDINNKYGDKSIVLAANNFTYFCVTFSGVASTATDWLCLYFTPSGGEDGFTVTFDKLKLEVGSVATAFTETNLVNIENAEKNSWIGRNLITNDLAQVYELVVPTNNTAFNTNLIPVYYGQKICYSFYVKSTSVSSLENTILLQFYDPAKSRIAYPWVAVPVSTEYTRIEGSIINNIQNANYISIGYRSTNSASRVLTYKNAKIEYGDTATPWTPAPEDCTFGTTEGEYMGTLVWDKPYPSDNPKDYTWGKVKGNDGKGIASVTEKYQVSSSSTIAPTQWSNTPPATTATNRYLWNYENITYTDGTSTETQKRVIGVYGDTGKGISSVTNYYLATTEGSGVTTSTGGWTPGVQAVTATSRYLWNYEVIGYTDGTSTTVEPHIIGVWGDTGKDAVIYSITPSVYCITKSVTNTFTPSSATLYFHKTTGSTTVAYTGYYKKYYSTDGTTYTLVTSSSGSSASITPSSTYKSVKCELYTDSAYTNMVDYQTVLIVSDGANGNDATNGVLTNDSVTLPANSSGVVSDFSTATGTFKVWSGSTDVTGTSVTYGSSASGCTGTITTAGVYSVTAMSANIGTLTLTATYSGVTITRIFSVSKAIAGLNGNDAVTVRLVPDKVVVDTDTNGHVTSAQLTNVYTTVEVRKGGAAYNTFTIGTLSKSSYIGCSVAKPKVTVTSIGNDPSTGYAYGSGYIDIPVTVDSVVYTVRLTVETNIHKVVTTLKQTTTEIYAQVTSLTQNVDGYETETDTRITAAEGKISTNVSEVSGLKTRMTSVEQTADSISLKVSETVLKGNLLAGTMFRREQEIGWNNPSDKGVISTSVQLGGVNSVYLESTSETYVYKGVKWAKIPVTKGKTYNMSFWYRTPDAAVTSGFAIEVQAFKSDGQQAEPEVFHPLVEWELLIPANNVWKLYKGSMTIGIGSDVASVDVLIYLATKGKMYVARPMLIEGSYVGWQRSEQDYDYIGGNLLDETKTLTKRGNVNFVSGTVAANAVGVCSSVHANPTTGYTEMLKWMFDYDLNADYTLSFMAKGTGSVDAYLYNDNVDVSLFSESGGVYGASGDGNTVISLTPEWKRHTVRWRTKSARKFAWSYLLLRVFSGNDAYIAQPKLEKGCTATEWTDGDGDMVSTKALLATGIDIKNRKVTITSDNVQVQNNSGATTFLIDPAGNIVSVGDASFYGRILATEFVADLHILSGSIYSANMPTMPDGFVYYYGNVNNSSSNVANYYLPVVATNKIVHKRIVCAGVARNDYQAVSLYANLDGDIIARQDASGQSQIRLTDNPNFQFGTYDGKQQISLLHGVFDLYGMNNDGYTVWYVVDNTPVSYEFDADGHVVSMSRISTLVIS